MLLLFLQNVAVSVGNRMAPIQNVFQPPNNKLIEMENLGI